MPPATILLLRHAEKTGIEGDRGLSPEGEVRAERLATWVPETYGTPDVQIASSDTPKSRRPNLTIDPLARATRLPIDDTVKNEHFKELAGRLLSDPRYSRKLVVVCWHQGKLPKLAKRLGAPAGSYPEKWGRETFDRVLRLDYQGSSVPNVTKVTQPF